MIFILPDVVLWWSRFSFDNSWENYPKWKTCDATWQHDCRRLDVFLSFHKIVKVKNQTILLATWRLPDVLHFGSGLWMTGGHNIFHSGINKKKLGRNENYYFLQKSLRIFRSLQNRSSTELWVRYVSKFIVWCRHVSFQKKDPPYKRTPIGWITKKPALGFIHSFDPWK